MEVCQFGPGGHCSTIASRCASVPWLRGAFLRRRTGIQSAPALEQLCLALRDRLEMARLAVPETADLLGKARQLHGEAVARGSEAREQRHEQLLVIDYQLPLPGPARGRDTT